VRLIKPLKLLEKFAFEKNLETEATTERLKEYPAGFKPNYTVKVTSGGKMMFVISFNARQFYFDEIDEEGKDLAHELEKQLKDAGLTRVR